MIMFHRIKDHAANIVSDETFSKRADKYPVDTPDTKEGYYIREIFERKSPTSFSFFIVPFALYLLLG